jgi:ATP synthase protein I
MSSPTPSAGAPFATALRGALAPSAVCGTLAVVVITVVRGGSALVSAGLGLVVALAFFGSGLFLMSRLVRSTSPQAFVAVAMSVYLGQVLLLLLFMIAFYNAAWLDGPAFGWAALVVTLSWQVFSMRAWRRARTLVYDEGSM